MVTKIAVILLAVTTIIAGVCLGEAETPSRTQPPPSPYRTLLPFETTPHAISLSRGEAQTLTPSGFGHVVSLLQNDKPVEALDRALLMAIHQPSLWRQRTFQLLIAECYFILGGDDPTLQFAYAKPLYERLLRFYPRWENQPLILFRLATIEERQGLTIEARAAYGVLVDWYPDDPLAESARLGLVMSGLRVDDLHDAEGQAQNVLDTAKDAQIRYHAAVCLGIIYHRLGRPADALSDFEKVVHWPADQDLLEDFELFGLGETFLDNQRFSEATQAFLTYLKRFPAGADRPMAIYDVATEAHRLGQEDEAVLGYRYLIDHYPLLYAGVKSELQLALLMMQVQPGQANPTTELLLRNVRDQNDFRDLNQKGGLELALYEINVGRPIEAMGELTDIIDRPLDPVDKPAAAQRMLQAFQNVLAANRANPMLLAKVFREFRPYVDSAGLPVESYVDLGEALYQNLQADTLLAISHNNPLAQAYPRQAMFLTAEGRRLRGEYDQAKVELARLLDIPLKPEDAGDGLVFKAHLLLAQIECDQGRLDEALRLLALIQTRARDDRERGQVELEVGLILLRQQAPEAAAQRLANAARLLDPATADEPLHGLQMTAAYYLGEALFESKRYAEAMPVLANFVQAGPNDERVYQARFRLNQARQTLGQTIPALTAPTAPPDWFWPRLEWAMNDYYLWLQNNQPRFGDQPDWENLP